MMTLDQARKDRRKLMPVLEWNAACDHIEEGPLAGLSVHQMSRDEASE
jgi:hypothetical protein